MSREQQTTEPVEELGDDFEFGSVSPFRSTLLVVLGVDLLALLLWRAWSNPGPSGTNRLALVVAGTIPVVVVAATRPLTRRLVLRSLARRKSQSLLLVLCGILATTALTASWQLDAGLKSSARNAAKATLGPVDELIFTATAEHRTRVQQLLTDTTLVTEQTLSAPPPNTWTRLIDGQLALVSAPVLLEQGSLSLRATAIELDVVKASTFGGDPADTGFSGAKAIDGKGLLLGADVAERSGFDRKKQVRLRVGGGVLDVTVSGIVPRVGLAALSLHGEARPLVVFVAPGTLVATAVEPKALRYVIAISNKGGVQEGLDSSLVVTNGLTDLLVAKVPTTVTNDVLNTDGKSPGETTPGETTPGPLAASGGSNGQPSLDASVVARKQDLFDNANKVNLPLLRLVRLLTTLMSFAAGSVLLGSCLAFAWARRDEVVTLRSLGFVRTDLLGFFALEAWGLALVSALSGSLLGTLLAWIAFPKSSGSGATGFSDLAPEISRIAGVSGFAAGFTALLLTVTAALAGSLMGAIADGTRKRFGSVRNQHRTRSIGTLLAGALGLAPIVLFGAWTLVRGIRTLSPFPLLFALGSLGLAGFLVLRSFLPTFPARVVVGCMVGMVALVGPFTWPKVFKRMDTGSVVLQTLLLVAAGVALLERFGARSVKAGGLPLSSAPGAPLQELTASLNSPASSTSSASTSLRDPTIENGIDLDALYAAAEAHEPKPGPEPISGTQAVFDGLRQRVSALVNEPVEEGQRMVPRELIAAQKRALILPGSDFVLLRRRGAKVVRKLLSSAYLRRPRSRTHGVRIIVSLLTASVLSIVLLRSSLATAVPGDSARGGWAGVVMVPNDVLRKETRTVANRFGVSAPVAVLGVAGSIGSQPLVGAELAIVERSFMEGKVPPLQNRLPELKSDQVVWDRVVTGDGVILLADALLNGSTSTQPVVVGKSVSLVDRFTGRSVSSPILGVARALPGLGTVVSGPKVAEALFGAAPPVNRLFIKARKDRVLSIGPLVTELDSQGLRYESLGDRLTSSTASTRRVLGLLQWLAGLIGLCALWSFLASRGQINADRASSFASLRAVGADPSVVKRIVRIELISLIAPGFLVGVICAFVLALRVVWSGGLGAGASFAIHPVRFVLALVLVVGSLAAGVFLLSRAAAKARPLTGMSTRRVN